MGAQNGFANGFADFYLQNFEDVPQMPESVASVELCMFPCLFLYIGTCGKV